MTAINTFKKDPNAVLDYQWDWANTTNGGREADWLAAGETIASATVTVPAGITKDSSTNTTTTVTVWLSGGTAGTYYNVVCRIVTTANRTDDRTIVILVEER